MSDTRTMFPALCTLNSFSRHDMKPLDKPMGRQGENNTHFGLSVRIQDVALL